jgi:transcriptional regulator with XRE-family HTH domain
MGNSTPKPSGKRPKLSISQKLSVIQPRWRSGDLTEIARRTGYDTSHVSRVINGISNNPSGEIVNEAYRMVGKRKV